MSELLIFTIIFILAFIFFKSRYNTILNPPSLFIFSFILSSLAVIISNKISDLTGDTHLVDSLSPNTLAYLYATSIGFFVLPWMWFKNFFTKPPSYDQKYFTDQKKSLKIAKTIGFLLFASLIAAILMLGSFPILEMINGRITIIDHLKALEGLPLGLMAVIAWSHILLTLYVSSLLCHIDKYPIKKTLITLLILLLGLSSLWQGNRQFILLTIFILMARWYEDKNNQLGPLSSFRLFIFVSIGTIVFIAVFFYIGLIRLGGTGASPYDLFGYLVWPAFNLLTIVNSPIHAGNNLVPNFILNEIVPHRLVDKNSLDQMKYFLFEPSSPSGYLSYWYLDYGYLGICIGSFLLGLVSYNIFMNRHKNENSMRLNILILWVCITSSVYAHFISLNFFLMPTFLLLLFQKIFPETFSIKKTKITNK